MVDDVFLVVDKPQGLTSQQVVARVKRQLKCRKVGHTGTLDPLATGVLPLALNRATRLIQYLDESRKVYSGEIELGVESDTLDRDGEIIAQHTGTLDYSERKIADVFERYLGSVTQVPPVYSAIKSKGRPLYSYARSGIEVTPPERQVEIESFTLLSYKPPLVEFRVVCSKGTYVRSLAADIGRDLGCGARIWSLRREASGPFLLDQAISLDELLEKASAHEQLPPRFLQGNHLAPSSSPSTTPNAPATAPTGIYPHHVDLYTSSFSTFIILSNPQSSAGYGSSVVVFF